MIIVVKLLRYFLIFFSFFLAEFAIANSSVDIVSIQRLDDEVVRLYQQTKELTGSDLDIINLQMLTKNNELRTDINDLMKDHKDSQKEILKKYVSRQTSFISEALMLVDKETHKRQQAMDEAKEMDKLNNQTKVDEIRHYHVSVLSDQWQNYLWMEALGQPMPERMYVLKQSVRHYLDFISASLVFDVEQARQIKKQLRSTSESNKAGVQLMSQISQREVDSELASMQSLIKLADKMGIDTTNDKRIAFDATGDITEDILNISVFTSIFMGWLDHAGQWLLDYAPEALLKLAIFIGVIFLGRILARFAQGIVSKAVISPGLKMSFLMQNFFISVSGKLIFFLSLLIALSQLGLDLTPILTGFGIAGVIIGFALQNTLSNFASGLMLLIYRPFDVGDQVEAGGVFGKVSHMSLVNTTIKTFDNQIIIIPNNKIWDDTIKNITQERVRRVDMVFGVGYDSDIEKVEAMLRSIVESHEKILKKPEYTIKLNTLNSSSLDFIVRPWVKTLDYWEVYWDITKEVKIQCDREGVSIPYPQQDVHLHMPENKLL
ncbi:Small-conductance mechanosensitive channel [invertebrate metagenome]|uniref:Small-conductance mechanosensitive channel n=1 Tax=invertebrate metagenome TaxID=1711999 RepID=A0A2H9T6Z9_9ZZZZ